MREPFAPTDQEQSASSHRVESPEHHVHPSRGDYPRVGRRAQRPQPHVDPKHAKEGESLLQEVAHDPVPPQHQLVHHVVVPLKLVAAPGEHRAGNTAQREKAAASSRHFLGSPTAVPCVEIVPHDLRVDEMELAHARMRRLEC